MPRKPSFETLSILQLMVQRPDHEHYGLELARAAEIATGTVYPILRRLERDGWVDSSWEDVNPSDAGRPRKRLYRLTGLGAREARSHLQRAQGVLAPISGLRALSLHPPTVEVVGARREVRMPLRAGKIDLL